MSADDRRTARRERLQQQRDAVVACRLVLEPRQLARVERFANVHWVVVGGEGGVLGDDGVYADVCHHVKL